MKMMSKTTRGVVLLMVLVALAGCSTRLFKRKPPPPPVIEACDPTLAECIEVQTPDEDTVRPKHRKGAVTTPVGTGEGFVEGVAAEELDTTSGAEKEAALDVATTAKEKELGKTIASLGAVAEQGFWLKTPLVVKEREGRVVWADNGNSVNVTLIPKQGEASAGSQISLAAMRALGIPLTGLPELIVFAK